MAANLDHLFTFGEIIYEDDDSIPDVHDYRDGLELFHRCDEKYIIDKIGIMLNYTENLNNTKNFYHSLSDEEKNKLIDVTFHYFYFDLFKEEFKFPYLIDKKLY